MTTRPGIQKCPPIVENLWHGLQEIATTIETLSTDNARLTRENGKLTDEAAALGDDLATARQVIVELQSVVSELTKEPSVERVSGVVIPMTDQLADNGALGELIEDSGAELGQIREVLATLAELPIKQVIRMTTGALAMRERSKLREIAKAK